MPIFSSISAGPAVATETGHLRLVGHEFLVEIDLALGQPDRFGPSGDRGEVLDPGVRAGDRANLLLRSAACEHRSSERRRVAVR